ncbi:unnamed protein product, partial [marine sediment metagenome]
MKKPIKICFISPNIYTLISKQNKGFGGAEVDTYNLARRLADDKNFKVSIICITDRLKKPEIFQGVLIIPIKPCKSKKTSRWK